MIGLITITLLGSSNERVTHIFSVGIAKPADILDRMAKKFDVESVDRMRVFATAEDATNKFHDGESLSDVVGLASDKTVGDSGLTAAGFALKDEGNTLGLFCRIDDHDDVAAVVNSKSAKQRKRMNHIERIAVEEAITFVWPRDDEGSPLPATLPVGRHTEEKRPDWVVVHLRKQLADMAAQQGLKGDLDTLYKSALG